MLTDPSTTEWITRGGSEFVIKEIFKLRLDNPHVSGIHRGIQSLAR